MFFRKLRYRKFEEWRISVITRLIRDILPPNIPFYYDIIPSFLQRDRSNLETPVKIDLFLPTLPLAIDVCGLPHHDDFREAGKCVNKSEWERLQSDASRKNRLLSVYGCPYLVIWDYEPFDTDTLASKVKTLTNGGRGR